ncbi:hypothetical protein BDZ91DRAFT_737310 [Kalaharituber pfeilii]|nr:hypothetical protein BDZ91DRAFT_737310 [Kalaharituber pfeilii]
MHCNMLQDTPVDPAVLGMHLGALTLSPAKFPLWIPALGLPRTLRKMCMYPMPLWG